MYKWIKVPVFLLVFVNIILCAWSVLHNTIYYYTDIGRDFLIFDEIVTKKFVIFGPRADMQGLFHGILWHYLNVPAYILANGNPVLVGWFWIGITVLFLGSVYYVVKRLFDEESALVALVLTSGSMVQLSQGFFHGNGAMLIMPLFFYSFIIYFRAQKVRYLVVHLISIGMMVQFEIALGVPLALLTVVASTIVIFRKKAFTHYATYLILIPFAATFLIIEFKYNFLQTQSFLSYLQGARDGGATMPFIVSFIDRLRNVGTHGVNIIAHPLHTLNFIYFAVLLSSIILSQIHKDSNRIIYKEFLYFYFGFYVLTMIHGGFLIMFWWLPMSMFPIMMFSSIHKYIPRFIFYGLVLLSVVFITKQNISFAQNISNSVETSSTSWRFRYSNTQIVVKDAPYDYGYFVYAPDIYGYQDKYALFYANRVANKHGVAFEKRALTYVLSEPPPKDFTGSDVDWWVREKLKIMSKPVQIVKLNGEYEARKYLLSKKDLMTPSLITVPTDWLFYR